MGSEEDEGPTAAAEACFWPSAPRHGGFDALAFEPAPWSSWSFAPCGGFAWTSQMGSTLGSTWCLSSMGPMSSASFLWASGSQAYANAAYVVPWRSDVNEEHGAFDGTSSDEFGMDSIFWPQLPEVWQACFDDALEAQGAKACEDQATSFGFH